MWLRKEKSNGLVLSALDVNILTFRRTQANGTGTSEEIAMVLPGQPSRVPAAVVRKRAIMRTRKAGDATRNGMVELDSAQASDAAGNEFTITFTPATIRIPKAENAI